MSIRRLFQNAVGRSRIDRLPREQMLAGLHAAFHRARLESGVSLEAAGQAMLDVETRLITKS